MQVQHKSRATPVLNPHDKHSPSFFADLVARLNTLVSRLFEGERSPGRSKLTAQGAKNVGEILQNIDSVHPAVANKGVDDSDRIISDEQQRALYL